MLLSTLMFGFWMLSLAVDLVEDLAHAAGTGQQGLQVQATAIYLAAMRYGLSGNAKVGVCPPWL